MKTKCKRADVVVIVAVAHFVLSVSMALWAFGIAMAHDDYDSPPYTSQEEAISMAAAIVNLPLVTLREFGASDFPVGGWWLVFFAGDSSLWAVVLCLLLPWLCRKVGRRMPTRARGSL
jgi:hypothetical protein